ncbi:MAG TPA: cytochrome P450 [Pseudonocardiaceae bacterium]|nr:cytochrome P450 [Pseudonocardiaceae bacterium]
MTEAEPVRLRRDFVQNPHELYRRLRSAGPAHQVVMWGGVRAWLITRYEEARALLADPRLLKDHARALALFPPGLAGPHGSRLDAHMLNSDPPDHTRLRRLVTKAFTSRAVAGLRPRIEVTVDRLLDQLPVGRTVDLIESFALPLPITVISALLGVPDADRDRFAAWTKPFITTAEPAEIEQAEQDTSEYLTALVAAKRAEPGDDVLSALVLASEDGDRLSPTELLAMAFLLILAGFETTVNLIGNGVHALVRSPAQLAALRADPALLPAAVEEFLRFESPLNMATNRFTDAPVPVGDVTIPAGEFVMIALLAANHDETRFAAPDELDITREPNAHLAFGHGIHYCLGAPLARLEGEIAFGKLLSRFSSITLADDQLTYRSSTLMRGLQALPVRLRA